MEKLKPCPFCGGKAEARYGQDETSNRITYTVVCAECHTGIFRANVGENEWVPFGSTKEAIDVWNRRTTNAE